MGLRLVFDRIFHNEKVGATYSTERKKEVYRIAQKFDKILLADDPYYHLYFDGGGNQSRVSFQSLDTDGRVLRFDSFSKIISSGIRMGYVSGHRSFLEPLQLDQQADELCPSGVSQALLLKLLQSWSKEGFEAHLALVRKEYRRRRDLAAQAAKEAFVGKKVDFHIPRAGMFLWLKLQNVDDTTQLISHKAVASKVLAVPGSAFYRGDERQQQSPFVRVSFSAASDLEIIEGMKRIASLVE